ncbi:hypothetical protein H5410_050322 [Solanum commersonii]|uniref:PB1-like domain-containing protein n=1 Tax=Solanum commersonii TaxID=4109 RepID=A0A9J5WWG5_SOLCO|nr:hypothetical protein H5410_050322 [Solanum commersonii]
MALTIMTLQFHYGGCFVSDPTLRYANGITSVEKINIDVDELHIMLFHKIVLELGVENVETFGCRVNKKGTFYMLNTDSDVLNFLNSLKGADFVDVYVVHPISIPLVVEEILVLPSTNADLSSSPNKIMLMADLSSSPQIDRADVSSSQPFDENENRDLNQNQSHLVEEQVEEHYDSDSLYDVDENIDDLSDLDEELLQARVNLDEIPFGLVGIDAGFEDIYKEKRGRFEGNLGGDNPYFDSSDPGSDISEDEGDPIKNDEVVDPAPRKESTKIYFDLIAKKGGTANLLYSEGNIKLKQKERIRAKCNKKGCPWHILGSIDGNTGNFSVKTYFLVRKYFKRTRNKLCTPIWISKHYKERIMSEPTIKLHQIQSLIQKQYGLYVSKTSCRKTKLRVMNEQMGDFREEFSRLYDYAEQLKTTNPGTTVSIRTSKNTIPGKEVFMSIYICVSSLKSGWKEGCRRIIGLDGAFLKSVCKGELLSCISKYGNNQMYPIAWACIKHDLELTKGEGLEVMSNMQKGLHLALIDVLPNAEIR